jgi:hypothetical protein
MPAEHLALAEHGQPVLKGCEPGPQSSQFHAQINALLTRPIAFLFEQFSKTSLLARIAA